jgi:hypothetical protein
MPDAGVVLVLEKMRLLEAPNTHLKPFKTAVKYRTIEREGAALLMKNSSIGLPSMKRRSRAFIWK